MPQTSARVKYSARPAGSRSGVTAPHYAIFYVARLKLGPTIAQKQLGFPSCHLWVNLSTCSRFNTKLERKMYFCGGKTNQNVGFRALDGLHIRVPGGKNDFL